MDIQHYTTALDVDIEQKALNGYTEIELNLSSATGTLLFDFTHLLKIDKIVVDNKKQRFILKEDQIFITNKSPYTAAIYTV